MKDVKDTVKKSYAQKLEKAKNSGEGCCSDGKIKRSFEGELIIPSFGCILNLTEKAAIKSGDIVIDLGSGPGYDLIQASKKVGGQGKVIGIDMTPEMVHQSQETMTKMGIKNVEIKLGEIEKLPLPDNFADVIISNCVINLSPDKASVFKEVFRVLKPGGSIVDADIIADQDLPQGIRENKELYCACVGGTLTKKQYIQLIDSAGFKNIKVSFEHSSTLQWKDDQIVLHNGLIHALKPK